MSISDASAVHLADQLVASGTNPLARMLLEELRSRVQAILRQLGPADREILLLRHVEELNSVECAEVLVISEEAAKKRYLRALQRFRRLLDKQSLGDAQ